MSEPNPPQSPESRAPEVSGARLNPRLTHKIPLLWVVLLVVGISGSSYAGYRYFHKPAPPPVFSFPACTTKRPGSPDLEPLDPDVPAK